MGRIRKGRRIVQDKTGFPVEAPKKRGRPSKLTKTVAAKIVEYLEVGNYQETAARAAGISRSTFHRWMKRGADAKSRGKDSRYRDFRDSVKKAEAEAEVRAVKCVIDASETKWQAAMTYLERKFPERWSRGERREHSGAIERPVQNLSVLSDEELDQLLVLTAKMEGLPNPLH
jgi:predicted DNA-binding protein (UPF0251 family)